jgi:hypothetical protein
MAEGIIIGGKSYPLLHPLTQEPITVLGPKDHGMEFKAGDGFNKKRKNEINLGAFHWTGSENALEVMFRVLQKRKLGIEYAINPWGALYQFCDMMEVDTADAGIVNSRSWGVEMVNAGIRRSSTLWREPRYRKVKMGPRQPYDTVIHDRKVRCWDFYVAQKMTAFALHKLISGVVPTYPSRVCLETVVIPNINATIAAGDKPGRPLEYITKGAIGHYNITRRKLDPGTRFMEELHYFMEHGNVPLYLMEELAVS